MNVVLIVAAVASLAAADTDYSYRPPQTYSGPAPSARSEVIEVVPILQDDRYHTEDGSYSVDVKTGNGIAFSQSGSPTGPNGAVIKAGEYSYTAPDGTDVHVKFVADGNGFQPQSDMLPVAPAFPHPIPDFVLRQIAFAEEEDAARARAEASQVRSASLPAPGRSYGAPQ
ncbi:cuticle protein AMP1A-like [Scylla paramamosain]|uniref:cuticle protein AMP1A-like n=1 Tax=Scylla paramamosain TaxID=85552 RepID=UPI003082F614